MAERAGAAADAAVERLFRQSDISQSGGEPVDDVLARKSRGEAKESADAKAWLQRQQSKRRGSRFVVPPGLREPGGLKGVKRTEARVRLRRPGEKRSRFVGAAGVSPHEPQGI